MKTSYRVHIMPMKISKIFRVLLAIFLFIGYNSFAQTPQLEVNVTTNGTTAIYAESDYGIGIHVESSNDIGLKSKSTTDIGVFGESAFSFGGKFINTQKDNPDLVIGGNITNANGIIASDPSFPGSSLNIRSYNSLFLQLDYNNDSDGFFSIKNGSGSTVMAIGEQGDMVLEGDSQSNRPQLLLKETEDTDYARLRLMNNSNNQYWDIAAGGTNNGELNFFRVNEGNILQLHTFGNPITTSTGAYLSPDGVWTDAPVAQFNTRASSVDPELSYKPSKNYLFIIGKVKARPNPNI